MIVEPSVALSIVVPAPTSTKSSRITFPICGTFENTPLASGVKPKPSAPIIAPELIQQLLQLTNYN